MASPVSEPETTLGAGGLVKPNSQGDTRSEKEARDRGLDLAEVHRSVGNEILRRSDVAQFSGGRAESPDSSRATGDVAGFTLVPLPNMRRIIAERMEAGSSVPTFTAEIEVDMTDLIRLRSDLSEHSNIGKYPIRRAS